MASSFLLDADDIGVLTATRIAPIASCTQRVVEPLIRIPKSAVISWLPIADTRTDTRPRCRAETLAIANVHSITFELSLDVYRASSRRWPMRSPGTAARLFSPAISTPGTMRATGSWPKSRHAWG